MALILAGKMAMELIRAGATDRTTLHRVECEDLLASSYPSKTDIDRLRRVLGSESSARLFERTGLESMKSTQGGRFAGTIEVVCKRSSKVRRYGGLIVHYCSAPLVDGAFRHVVSEAGMGSDVYVVAPVLGYVFKAREAGFAQTLAYGMELCGSYSPDPDTGRCRYDVRPVSTRMELARDLKALEQAAKAARNGTRRVAGLRRCLETVPYLLDGSASPMETIVASILTLPAARGGWGVKGLSLNARVDLSREEARIAHRSFIRPDGLVADKGVGYEYDSTRFHDGADRELGDRLRLASAQLGGLRLIPITWDVVEDEERFDAFCSEFARATGKRVRPPSEETIQRRRALRKAYGLPVLGAFVAYGDDDAVPLDLYDRWQAA